MLLLCPFGCVFWFLLFVLFDEFLQVVGMNGFGCPFWSHGFCLITLRPPCEVVKCCDVVDILFTDRASLFMPVACSLVRFDHQSSPGEFAPAPCWIV